jgi:hypothetical protein
MPNPLEPPMAQWLRSIHHFDRRQAHTTIKFFRHSCYFILFFYFKIQIWIPEKIPFQNQFLQDFSEYHIQLFAARIDSTIAVNTNWKPKVGVGLQACNFRTPQQRSSVTDDTDWSCTLELLQNYLENFVIGHVVVSLRGCQVSGGDFQLELRTRLCLVKPRIIFMSNKRYLEMCIFLQNSEK